MVLHKSFYLADLLLAAFVRETLLIFSDHVSILEFHSPHWVKIPWNYCTVFNFRSDWSFVNQMQWQDMSAANQKQHFSFALFRLRAKNQDMRSCQTGQTKMSSNLNNWNRKNNVSQVNHVSYHQSGSSSCHSSAFSRCHLSCANLQYSCTSAPQHYGGVLIHLPSNGYTTIQDTKTAIILWGGGIKVTLQFDHLIYTHHAAPREHSLHPKLVARPLRSIWGIEQKKPWSKPEWCNQRRRHQSSSSRLKYKSHDPEWK